MTFNQNRGSGSNRTSQRENQDFKPSFNEKFNPEWIQNGITQETVTFSDQLGKFIKEKGLTTSQIRNVFGEIKRIQMKGFENEKASFFLLKPKIAYAAKRQNDLGINTLKKFFDLAHLEVSDAKSYQNFVDFFEAILAYHKSYGGKD